MSEWNFITSHGLVLANINQYQNSTARKIAQAINITERSVRKIINDLESEGYIERQKVGRNNVYYIRPHQGLRHETTENIEVGDLLRVLSWKQQRPSSK
ncbi:helix-turn-helix transcriptional regulator [Chloroflexota bacterium]